MLENPQSLLTFNSDKYDTQKNNLFTNNRKSHRLSEGTTNVPHKAFSVAQGSSNYQHLYNEYYQEILQLYEGLTYKTPEFESIIIESYLRRKIK